MGMLLMQYEYQIAEAKKTLYQRRTIEYNNKLQRYTERIGKVTELFSKRESQIESFYNNERTRLSGLLSNSSSLSDGITNIASYFGIAAIGQLASSADVTAATTTITDTMTSEERSSINAAIARVKADVQAVIQRLIDEAKEQALNELEVTKEAQLEPLHEKEAEMTCKKNTNETLAELADQRAEKAKARLQKDVPNSAAGYGLS